MHRTWIPFILSVLLLKLCKCILISSNSETNFEFIVELNGPFSRHISVNSSSPLLNDVHMDNTFYNISENNNTNLKITKGNDHQQYLVHFAFSSVIATSRQKYTFQVSNEENETLGFNVVIKKAETIDVCIDQKKALKLTVTFNQSITEHVCLVSSTPIKSIVASHFIDEINSEKDTLYKADIINYTSLVLFREGAKVGQYIVTFFYNSVTYPINNTYDIYNMADLHLTLHLQVKLEDHLAICIEDKDEKVVFADEGTSVNISFCVLSSSDLLDNVLVNGEILTSSSAKREMKIVIKKNEAVKHKFDVFLLIEKKNKYNGTKDIKVINKAGLRLNLKVIIKWKGIYFTLEKQGMLYAGEKQTLKCELPYSPNKTLQITKRFTNTTLASGKSCIMYTLHLLSCSDMGTYICENTEVDRNKTFVSSDVHLHLCPPVMCEGFFPNLTMAVSIGDNVTVMFCVISPNLAPNLEINDDVYTYNVTSDTTFKISQLNNGSTMYHFIYFSIFNVVPKHARFYTMRLNTTDNKTLNLSLYVKLIPDNLQLCEKEASQEIMYANIGDNLTLETCVNVSLHNVLHRLAIGLNGTHLYQSGCQLNFCVLWSPCSMHSCNTIIYIKLYDITYEQFNMYTVFFTTMYNNTDVISVLNYTLDIRLKENCTSDVNVTKRGPDDISLSVSLGANLRNQQFTIKTVAVDDSIFVVRDIYLTAEEDGVHNIVRTIGDLKYNTRYMINISLSAESKTEFECNPFIMYDRTTADEPTTANSQFLLVLICISMALVTLFLAFMTLLVFLVKTKRIVLKKKLVSSRSKSHADIVRRDVHADTDYVNLRNEPDAFHYNNISDSVLGVRPTSDKLLNTDYFKQYPGRYTSNGLIYVTIDHSQTRRKPSHHSSFNKADKVTYVQIDRSKSLNIDSSSTYCNTKSICDSNFKLCKEFSVDKSAPS